LIRGEVERFEIRVSASIENPGRQSCWKGPSRPE
jgi:hypothetical protein